MKKEQSGKTDKPRDPSARTFVTSNRRARFEYEILDTYDAGLVLVGTEVKSLRAGRVNVTDAFCRIERGEAWVYNMYVAPFEQGNRANVEPVRKRKLLLHTWQINELRRETDQKGLTVVPLSLYFQRGFAKMEIGLARGKKLYDKRDSIAERDQLRESQRSAKNPY